MKQKPVRTDRIVMLSQLLDRLSWCRAGDTQWTKLR